MSRVIHGFLSRSAQLHPEKFAICCDGTNLTYAALEDRARRLATLLLDAGVERGDRVMILLENRAECAIALFGALFAGAAYTFVSPQIKADKLEFLLQDAEPKFVITEPPLAGKFANLFREASGLSRVFSIGASAGAPVEGQTDFASALDSVTDTRIETRTIELESRRTHLHLW
ncbi:MAG: AMP-binding protein [Polyangiaceae bacterium]